MTMVILGVLIVATFVAGSLGYVYAFRGAARYESFGEYMRKGWPLFAPLNCLLYTFTQNRAARPIMDVNQFKELAPIQENWQVIREEALRLFEQGTFDHTKNPNEASYYDIGFRTFYKYGWSKFYLTWYGYTHASAQKLCPKTVEILEKIPSVNGAMFSLLPPGSQLTRHLDPVACSLRYHLGLRTPNADSCFINVDGNQYSWRDGEAFMFDETYLHYAKNNSDTHRVILMCDIERPLHIIGRVVNFLYKGITRLTVVPNMEGDKRGLVNTIFSTLSPLLKKTKALKQTNRPAYLTIKYSVNLFLIIVVFAIIAGVFDLAHRLYVWTAGV
jgi:beta-hydroxylase